LSKSNLVAIILLVLGAQLSAQSLTVGNTVGTPNSSDGSIAAVRTDVDLASPANATGDLTSVTFYWSSAGCSNAVKVKVYRRVGDTFTQVAERGPFTPSTNAFTTALSPAIAVKQGDLIAVSRVASCGNPGALVPGYQNNYLQIAGEPSSFTLSQAGKANATLAVKATGTATESVAGVIPAVASNTGNGGAYFRTIVQMMGHPPVGSTPLTGKLVFHRLGVPGGPSDPSMPFSVMPGEMVSWDDILVSAGYAGAPASVDVVVPWGHALPVVTTHLFNDQGANGTTGFRQDVVDLRRDTSQIFTPGMWGYILGPTDAVKYRCNIGVRTLEAGAEGTIEVHRADGTSLGTKSFRYGPNTYDQKTFQDFTGITLEDALWVKVTLQTGTAIVYGSVVDNTTGDPANVLARTYEGVI
jgi:hypothetical protein